MFLTLDFPPVGGGIARYLYEIVRLLPPNYVTVVGLSAPGWKAFDRRQPFAIRRIKLPLGWKRLRTQLKFLAPLYLWHSLMERKASHVMCGQAHYSLMLPAFLLQMLTGASFGIFAYGMDLLEPQTRIYRPLFNLLLRSAEVVVVESGNVAGIARRLGVDWHKLHVIHPGIDPQRYQSGVQPVTIKAQYDLHGKRCLLTVGRLVERKGHDVVLRALPRVIEAVPNVHYLIVGTGSYEATLRSLVAELGLSGHVTFAGHVPDQSLSAFYAVSELFVMVSREIVGKGDMEGFGIVYLEAGLHGKPVIAGLSGGVPDAVVDEQTGLLIDPNDIPAVSDAIVRLLSDGDLADRLGSAGRHRVVEQFNSATMAQQFLSALRVKWEQ